MRYEVVDGVSYPTPLEDTKQFSREMELYGGKSLVLVDALLRWFAALWHGRPLAAVIALVSTGIAALLWYVARHPGPAYPYDDVANRDDAGR